MGPNSARWHEVSRSDFAHEREGLAHVRELLPDRGPFHAWSNFEFRDGQGRWAEVDLLVLGEGRLHLVELKHYRGQLGGTAYRWQRGNRSEDSPLPLARRKAQRIKSVLSDAARALGLPPERVPFVQECVFLHAPDHRCLLADGDKADLFGVDGASASSHLPSIADRLLEPDRGRHDRQPFSEADLLRIVDKAGFAVRRERTVGSWRLTGAPLAEGEGWQDWPAEHGVALGDEARIRFFTVPDGAGRGQIEGRRLLVQREFRLTERLRHDGVLSPRDLVDHELGPGLVYPHDARDQRLDLWLADHARDLSLALQVGLVRQVAEAVQYAHANGVVHRGLNPTAITVRGSSAAADPRIRVGGWQVAGVTDNAGSHVLETKGMATRMFGHLDQRGRADRDERLADVYVAPEGQWSDDAHRVKLDVFALGALSYLLVTGQPPATSALELKQRLAREQGLDLAVDLSEAGAELRAVVREATSPRVSDRLRDVSAFLERLSAVERGLAGGVDTVVDPLEAPPGTLLGDRFELLRRLGSGSTAVGLLVRDQGADGATRVLKVARDDAAARRLSDEAEVLAGLAAAKHPRIVRIVEPHPIRVGERTALVLESAGEETLGDILRERRRLSLDLLERWGVDLLDILVGLDTAGVDHRDIKPANLGVREQRSDRAKHLVLFDFSLSRASAATLGAGTPPYLDPFLGQGKRTYWDSAAERYAVAVTLFEMSTGHAPVYGDGASDPAVIDDAATVVAADFDPAIADAMVAFFTRCLARSASDRFGTAAEMLTAWRTALSATATTAGDTVDAEVLTERATLDTPLPQSGLTPRALSALEPFRLATVGDLAALDTGRLSRFTGIVDVTKREIRSRAKLWREKYADQLRERPREADDVEVEWTSDDPLADPRLTAQQLVTVARGRKANARATAAAVLLGLEGPVPAFATLDQLTGPLGLKGRPQVSTALAALRDAWADHAYAAPLLDDIARRAFDALDDLDGAAWADDVAEAIAPASAGALERRIIAGMVRVALDRADDKAKGADEDPPLTRRRRRVDARLLLATDEAVSAAAGRLGLQADRLLADAVAAGEYVVTRARALPSLRALWTPGLSPLGDEALVRLAARMGDTCAATTRGDVYALGMPAVDAVALSFGATTPGQTLSVEDVRRLVRIKFPLVAELPTRPALDDVVREAGTGLEWVEGRYVIPSAHSDTTFLSTTRATSIPVSRPLGASEDPVLGELADSVRSASYLALGVRDRDVEGVTATLLERFGGVEVNVTDLLLDGLRAEATKRNVPWDLVMAADAADEGSRDAQGLAALVQQVLPAIESAVDAAVDSAPEGTRPVLLTDAAPLARYRHTGLLSRLAEMGARRANAVWLVVPQGADAGPMLDGVPVPRAYSSQFQTIDSSSVLASATTAGA